MPTMDYEKQAQRSLQHITTSETIHPDNKDLINRYYRHMLLSGVSAAQRQKVMAHIKIVMDHLDDTSVHDLETDVIEEKTREELRDELAPDVWPEGIPIRELYIGDRG